MDKPFCVGEDKCGFLNGKLSRSAEPAAGKVAPRQEFEMSSVVVQERKDDGMSQWMGVYCPHYQRFYCTGGADGCKTGCCATASDYEKSLAEHMEKLK
jgi:hypothetical protein